MFVQGWRSQAQRTSEISVISHQSNDTTQQDSVLSQIAAASSVILRATLLDTKMSRFHGDKYTIFWEMTPCS
jgi:hypothetical protein